jgi:hypothetical protein
VRSCLQVCYPILTPSSSIYRPEHRRQVEPPRGWPLGPMGIHHVEAQDQPTKDRFGRSRVGRPQVGPSRVVLSLSGCPMGP